MVNHEVSLASSWFETCVITNMQKRILVAGQPNRGDSPESATFKLKDCKLYVPVVTLSTENDNRLLEQLKTGYKEQSNRINIDQKCLIRLKIAI